MFSQELSVVVDTGGRSQSVAISGTSAQSAAITPAIASSPRTYVLATPTVDVFVRQGTNPTATSDGTDIFLLGGASYRLDLTAGNKLAFKTTGATGLVYLTPAG